LNQIFVTRELDDTRIKSAEKQLNQMWDLSGLGHNKIRHLIRVDKEMVTWKTASRAKKSRLFFLGRDGKAG
jgi:hypothetical protein